MDFEEILATPRGVWPSLFLALMSESADIIISARLISERGGIDDVHWHRTCSAVSELPFLSFKWLGFAHPNNFTRFSTAAMSEANRKKG